jgi:hypothetical protein
MGLGFKQNEGGKKRSTSQLVNLPILLPTLYLSLTSAISKNHSSDVNNQSVGELVIQFRQQ